MKTPKVHGGLPTPWKPGANRLVTGARLWPKKPETIDDVIAPIEDVKEQVDEIAEAAEGNDYSSNGASS